MISLTKAEIESLRSAHGFAKLDEFLKARLESKHRVLRTLNPEDPGFTITYARRQAEANEIQQLLCLLEVPTDA